MVFSRSKLHPARRNDILSTTYFVWNLTFYPIWFSLVIIYQLTYIIFPWYRSSSVVYLIFLYIVIYCRSYKMAAYVNLLKWSYYTALEAWFSNTTSFRYYMIYEHNPWWLRNFICNHALQEKIMYCYQLKSNNELKS